MNDLELRYDLFSHAFSLSRPRRALKTIDDASPKKFLKDQNLSDFKSHAISDSVANGHLNSK
jgi:hypothetical protein